MSRDHPSAEFAAGVILSHGTQFFHVHVQLETGDEVVAVVPKAQIRRLGFIRDLVGWKARVKMVAPPKMHRIQDLQPPDR